MESVLAKVESHVHHLQSNFDIATEQLDEVQKECTFCAGMVNHIIKQFAKYGEQYNLRNTNEDHYLPLVVIGETPMHDMLRNNLIDL